MSPALWVPLVVTNAFGFFLALMCWFRPAYGQALGALLFLGAATFNAFYAIEAPQAYLGFRPYAWLPPYRLVIDTVWPAYGTAFVLAIALGQLAVGALLLRGGPAGRLGAAGAIVFLLAITPLGLAAGFPFPLIAAIAFATLLVT